MLLAAFQARARSQADAAVTTPRQQFGADIGDDYFLATYAQFEAYWKRLDAESDRVRLLPIGSTTEGRTQWMAVVSSPENLAALDRYKDMARRLALAEGVTDVEARRLAAEAKTIVCIAGGLHADEVLGAQQLLETVYQLASATDGETTRILRDVIVLVVHANPDGHALVADWYMRESDPRRRTLDGVPRLYHKYAGHDLNRDFFLASQAETTNINRVLYREWFPQIVYDHHQSAPEGTVMFAPPFRGPSNYVFDPLILPSIDLLGAAMHARFAAEGKAGVTMRGGSTYSTWWNGGLRTAAYFHNQIGLLTETIGSPTPGEIPYVASRQVPSADLPFPIAPRRWHFRQSVDYSLSANRAVLDAASRYRETLLLNTYRMGRNAIARGSDDSWIASPGLPSGGRQQLDDRAPRLYVLPADQPDFPTATKVVDALLKGGIVVHQASAAFVASGKRYPAGSYVVKTAQAFRPHILDMFEPQQHPDARPEPRASPTPPYDLAGWTLAFQMGVAFDRILDPIDGPFKRVTAATPVPGIIGGDAKPAGYLLSHRQNDAFAVVNELLDRGEHVWWPRDRALGRHSGTGAIYVAAGPQTGAVLRRAAGERGISATGVARPPAGPALRLRRARVGLWDRYGGATTSGWIRWILEQYGFPFELVYAKTLDAGHLTDRFDVLILPDEAVPGGREQPADSVPAGYRHMTGTLSRSRTVPRLVEFVEGGGTLIAIGDATGIARSLGVPVKSALVTTSAGAEVPLSQDRFYIPGSLLRVQVDNTAPLGYGFERAVDVMFDNSPAFSVTASGRVRRVAWYGDRSVLRSGWAWGQEHLRGSAAVVDAQVGRGRVLLLGPEVTFRAQSHGTFKFLFNAIHMSGGQEVARLD
jgi:hypothetical protein